MEYYIFDPLDGAMIFLVIVLAIVMPLRYVSKHYFPLHIIKPNIIILFIILFLNIFYTEKVSMTREFILENKNILKYYFRSLLSIYSLYICIFLVILFISSIIRLITKRQSLLIDLIKMHKCDHYIDLNSLKSKKSYKMISLLNFLSKINKVRNYSTYETHYIMNLSIEGGANQYGGTKKVEKREVFYCYNFNDKKYILGFRTCDYIWIIIRTKLGYHISTSYDIRSQKYEGIRKLINNNDLKKIQDVIEFIK